MVLSIARHTSIKVKMEMIIIPVDLDWYINFTYCNMMLWYTLTSVYISHVFASECMCESVYCVEVCICVAVYRVCFFPWYHILCLHGTCVHYIPYNSSSLTQPIIILVIFLLAAIYSAGTHVSVIYTPIYIVYTYTAYIYIHTDC